MSFRLNGVNLLILVNFLSHHKKRQKEYSEKIRITKMKLLNILLTKAAMSIKFNFQSTIKHLFMISIVFIVLFMIYFQYSVKFAKKLQRTPAEYNIQLKQHVKSKVNSSSVNMTTSQAHYEGWNLYDKIMQKLKSQSKPECPLIPPNLGE